MPAEAFVKTLTEGGVATITFFHPQSNALPGAILRELSGAITSAGAHEACRVIVLRSEGERAFCAGASFDELIAISDEAEGLAFFSGFAAVINAIRTCPVLVIGRVQGKAVGGGVGIASATDICYATKFASVKLSELAVGIGPFVVGPAVERKLGTSAMSQLAIDATSWKNADWAHDKGLYAEVFDTTDELDAAVSKLASKLAASNPEAMTELKKTFWTGCEHWGELLTERAAISGRLVLSDFTKESIASFKTK